VTGVDDPVGDFDVQILEVAFVVSQQVSRENLAIDVEFEK
jgi:hypothetical protein